MVFTSDAKGKEKEILEILEKVIDPEIGIDIVNLGLIYEVRVSDKKAYIKMTLTSPTCPLGGYIISEAERLLRQAGYEPEIDLTFDPPWNIEMIHPKKREELLL